MPDCINYLLIDLLNFMDFACTVYNNNNNNNNVVILGCAGFLTLLYWIFDPSVTYDDCCLKYVKRMSRGTQKHAVDYRLQVTDGGCNIPAVIFVMRKGRVFCTDPREKWVEELRERIDKRNPQKMPRSTIHDGRTEAEGDCLLQ
uniref:Chemokine (C-C motif) ligand 25a n=1 Tax=Dicentrarchus labrax TaxID=13489 RepID=A0A8P4KBD5_DICLA